MGHRSKALHLLYVSWLAGCAAHDGPEGQGPATLDSLSGGESFFQEDAAGNVRQIETNLPAFAADPIENAWAFLYEFGAILDVRTGSLGDAEYEAFDDGEGVTVFEVEEQGVPVFGAEVRVVTDGDGNIRQASANVPANAPASMEVVLSEDDARARARERTPRGFVGEAELLVFSPGLFVDEALDSYLAYRVRVFRNEANGSADLFIDAQTGDVLLSISSVRHLHRNVYRYQGHEAPRDGSIEGLFQATALQQVYNETGPVAGTTPGREAENVYRALGLANQRLSIPLRTSLWDGGIRAIVEDARYENNAVYLGGSLLAFGNQMTSVDIVVHELTHRATRLGAGLEYFAQSGALDESIADTFAAIVEGNFTLVSSGLAFHGCSGLGATVLRDMQDPRRCGLPRHMDQRERLRVGRSCTSSAQCGDGGYCWSGRCYDDSGAVHTNSSIINHAMFLLINGGQHQDSRIPVRPLGRVATRDLLFRTMERDLGPSHNFARFRNAMVARARRELRPAQCGSVINAFAAVGIGRGDCNNDCIEDDESTICGREDPCAALATCGDCAQVNGCGWCAASDRCVAETDRGACEGGFNTNINFCRECGAESSCGQCTRHGGCTWCNGSCVNSSDRAAVAACAEPIVVPNACGYRD